MSSKNRPLFKKAPRQREAIDVLSSRIYSLLVGGSRSGKTFILEYAKYVRATKRKSRHLVIRKRFNSIKRSIWLDTLPKMLSICYPNWKEGIHYKFNKTYIYTELSNGSQIWYGGLDDDARLDTILGTEYSTIHFNESSEISYDQRETVMSRLAENSGLILKCWDDCNPPTKKHWIYKLFIEGVDPKSGKNLTEEQKSKYGWLLMNPLDNKANLPAQYFDFLDGLSDKKRKRFRDGIFDDGVEGAAFSSDLIYRCQSTIDDLQWALNAPLTIVALDPNVAGESNVHKADEAGIIVMSKNNPVKDNKGHAVVIADHSGKMTTTEWSKKAVWAYKYYGANYIVAEKNQGGELVKTSLRVEDSTIPVNLVHASKNKYARTEPVEVLYENGHISHLPGLEELEDEMSSYIPGITESSPNRMDALVWGAHDLFLSSEYQKTVQSVKIR